MSDDVTKPRLWTRRTWLTLAAMGGFVAVAVGAFAAHGIHDPKAQDWLRTGAIYGFMHTMATFACAVVMELGGRRARFAPVFFLAGTAIFSGTLYAMALGAPHWLGAITPIGGTMFLIGWGVLAWAARDVDRQA